MLIGTSMAIYMSVWYENEIILYYSFENRIYNRNAYDLSCMSIIFIKTSLFISAIIPIYCYILNINILVKVLFDLRDHFIIFLI